MRTSHLSPADVDAELDELVRQGVEDGADLQLADAEDAHDAHDDVREEPIALERRGRLEPHLLEFVGHAGIGEDARPPGARGDAGGDAGRRHGSGAGRELRLSPREPREGLAVVEVTAFRDDADALLDEGQRVWVFLEGHAEHLGEALGREVVVRGAQAASDDEQVRLAAERVPQAATSRSRSSATVSELVTLTPASAEVVADEGAVGVRGCGRPAVRCR